MKKTAKRGRKKIEIDYLDYDNPIDDIVEQNKSKTKKYKSVLYDGQVYKADECVQVVNRKEDSYPFVCRIKELLLIEQTSNRFLPIIYVQWYDLLSDEGSITSTTCRTSSTSTSNA